MDKIEIQNRINVLRNETTPKANTKERVATIFDDLLNGVDERVQKVTDKSLILDAEIARLAGVTNQDVSNLVVKVTGSGLISDTEKSTFNAKQEALVSGTNIKTVNGVTLLGSGDLVIGSNIFRGAINLSTLTPVLSGLYQPTVSGTYTNFGGTVVNLLDGITLISFDGTSTYGKQVNGISSGNPKNEQALKSFVTDPVEFTETNLATLRTAGYLLRDNTVVTDSNNFTIKDYNTVAYDYLNFTGVRAKSSVVGSVFLLGKDVDGIITRIENANSKTSTPHNVETGLKFDIKKYASISICYYKTPNPTLKFITGEIDFVLLDSVKTAINNKVNNDEGVLLKNSKTEALSVNKTFEVLGDFKKTEIVANLATTLVDGWVANSTNNINSGVQLKSQLSIPVTVGKTYIYYSSLAWDAIRKPTQSILGNLANGDFIILLRNGEFESPNPEIMHEFIIPVGVVSISVTFTTTAVNKQFGLKKVTIPKDVKSYIDEKIVLVPSLKDRLDKLDTFTSITASGGVYRLDQKLANNFKSTIDSTVKVGLDIIPLNSLQNQVATLYLKANATPVATNYPPNAKWKDNVVPTIVSGKEYFIVFQSFNYGQTWLASFIGEWSSKKTVAFDNFIRANNTTTMGTTVEGGLAWNVYGNAWGIKSNMPYQETPNFPSTAYVNGVNPYVTITAIFNSNTNANAIAFKIKDATNYNIFQLNAITNLATRRRFLDSSPTASADYTITPAPEYVMQVKLEESGMITFYCNGIELGSFLEEINKTEARFGLNRQSVFEATCNYFSIIES